MLSFLQFLATHNIVILLFSFPLLSYTLNLCCFQLLLFLCIIMLMEVPSCISWCQIKLKQFEQKDHLPKKRFFTGLQTVSLYGTLWQPSFICTKNGKKKRKVCLKQTSISKTMLSHYFFYFWNCLLSILTKFMIHTWNNSTKKVSECFVNLYFKYCILSMCFSSFRMRLFIFLHFKAPSLPPVQLLWILSLAWPWSKWCLWLGSSPQYPTQPKHRFYRWLSV